MSSSLHLYLDEPVDLAAWLAFCRENDVAYSPRTIGGNVFYRGPNRAPQVEVWPGHDLEACRAGHLPDRIRRIDIGSFHGSNLDVTGSLARSVAVRFPCRVHAAPELAAQVVGIPWFVDPGDIEDDLFIPPDVEAGRQRDAGALTARVEAGPARLDVEDGLVVLDIAGVRVACFRDLRDGMLFAGRFCFRWWNGPKPAADAPMLMAAR